ncbi:MAG: hypothetical protein FWG81_05380 [Betaproteobacteria bacterium]|nr:hypothetical protein [Betaproteobacteria bacterium]
MSRTLLNSLLVVGIPIVTMMGGCADQEAIDYAPREGKPMLNEILEYVEPSKFPYGQVDATHLVEKYIKIGDSYETAKDILLKNGFSVYEYSVEEAKNLKEERINITYRIDARYRIEQRWWRRRDIRIFLGNSPESEIVDRVLAKVNRKEI